MPEGLMSLLFSNIDPIYEFHRGFLKELDQRLALWSVPAHRHSWGGGGGHGADTNCGLCPQGGALQRPRERRLPEDRRRHAEEHVLAEGARPPALPPPP